MLSRNRPLQSKSRSVFAHLPAKATADENVAEDWPKVKTRHTRRVSPWMAIIEREVEFAAGAECEIYHAVSQQDYIAIVAALPDGRLPIVRQYRPALESFTWELPAGLMDPDEDVFAACCRRELSWRRRG